jgi:hypothetical protein
MMGRIPGDVRGGLMELFYGVYNLDADRCLDALIAMGVLVGVSPTVRALGPPQGWSNWGVADWAGGRAGARSWMRFIWTAGGLQLGGSRTTPFAPGIRGGCDRPAAAN